MMKKTRVQNFVQAAAFVFLAVLLWPTWNSLADPIITPVTSSNKDLLIDRLQGIGVDSITVPALQSSVGLVDNANESEIPFTNGVYLTTGVLDNLDNTPFKTNSSVTGTGEMGTNLGTGATGQSEPFLTELNRLKDLHADSLSSLYDPGYFVMRVTPQYRTLNIAYTLVSEEYYRDNTLNTADRFAIFVNGTNAATLVDQSGSVVNVGLDTVNMKTNQTFFIPNVVVTTNNASSNTQNWTYDLPPSLPLHMYYNGATKGMVATIRVTPNTQNVISFVIADYGTHAYDTTLFIQEFGITSGADIRVDAAGTVTSTQTNFTVTVSNPGPIPATDIVVTNLFPAGLVLLNTNCTGNVKSWQVFGLTNVFVITSLARGASETIRFDCKSSAFGTYTNWAVAWPSEGDYDPANNVTNAVITITNVPLAVLSLNKTVASGLEAGHAWTVRGTNLTYAIAVTNVGDGATGSGWTMTLSDVLPVGVTLAGDSITNWTLPILSPGASWMTNLTVAVAANAPDSLTNRCTLLYGGSVTNAQCLTPVRQDADLAIWMTPSTNSVGLVRTYQYEVTVTNAGPDAALAVMVTLGGVPGLTLTPNAGDLGPFDLASGASRHFFVDASALLSLAGSVTNTVLCVSPVNDPDQANNTAKSVVLFDAIADVGVYAAWSGSPVPGNAPVRLSVAVTNLGPSSASSVLLSLTLPGPVSTNLSLGSLTSGGSTNVTFWVTPTVGALTLAAHAVVQHVDTDPVAANDTSDAETDLLWPDVSVRLRDVPHAEVASGGLLTYTLTVSNAVVGVTGVITDLALPGTVAWVANGGGIPFAGGLRFGPYDLAAGASSNWTVVVRAPVVATSTDLNATATITPPLGDTVLGNNSFTVTTEVEPPPKADVQIAVDWPVNPASGSTNTTYQFTVLASNLSAHTATNVTITAWLDEAPVVLTSPAGWQPVGVLTSVLSQAIVSLPALTSTGVTFSVRLTGLTNALIAHAHVETGNEDVSGNNEASQRLNLNWPDVGVTLTDAPDPVESGKTFTYTLRVSATGPAVSGLTAVLDLPDGLVVTDAAGGTQTNGDLYFGPFALTVNGASNWTVHVCAPTVATNTWLTATATVAPPFGDTNAADDRVSATTEVTPTPPADVQTTVFWQPAGPMTGSTNTAYQFYATVSNLSATATATNVMLTAWLDASPASLGVPFGWQATGALTDQLSQAVGSLPPGAVTGAWFSVTLSGVATALTARASAVTSNDDNLTNNEAQANLQLNWPDVGVTLTDAPDPVVSGQMFDYTLRVSASGVAVSGLTADLQLPGGLQVADAAGGTPIAGGLRFGPFALSLGGSSNWLVHVRAPMVATNTWLTATATVVPPFGDTNAVNDRVATMTEVTPPPPAEVAATVVWQGVSQTGSTNTIYLFYAAVSNLSATAVASNVTLKAWLDASPAGVAVPAGWQAAGALTAQLAQVVGSLPPGSGTGAWFRVMLTGVTGNLIAHALVSSSNDILAGNNEAQSGLVLLWPDVSITLADAPDPVVSGDVLTYTLTVSSTGADVSGLIADLVLPALVTNVVSAGGGTPTSNGLRFGPCTLANGGTTNWTVRVRVASVESLSMVVTTATVVPPLGDTNPGNDTATTATTVNPSPKADVKAYVSWQTNSLAGGTNTDYLFYAAVTNLSITAATNVSLKVWLDSVPATLAVPVGCLATGSLTDQLAQAVVTLQPQTGTGAWFRVRLTGVTSNLMAHVLAGANNDTNGVNNQADAPATLNWPDLRLTLTPGSVQVNEGVPISYTLSVVNDSGVPVTGIWVTNAYPAYVTVTNAGVGSVVNGTNVCFGGISLAAYGSTSLTVRVYARTIPAGVTSLVTTASCLRPLGDGTSNNEKRSEIPLFGTGVKAALMWVYSHNSGTYLARLVLTNASSDKIDSVWFSFNDRFVPNTNQIIQSALWCSRRVEDPLANHIVTNLMANGARYVDLTVAVSNALMATRGRGYWNPGEVVSIGVSTNTLAEYARIGEWSVTNKSERLLEMYDRSGENPGNYVDLTTSLGWKSGSIILTPAPGIGDTLPPDFKISPIELAAARVAWLGGIITSADYQFLVAASYGGGYMWDTDKKRWVVLPKNP